MPTAYLFGGSPLANSLEQFATIVSNALGLAPMEERFSENWPRGRYFLGAVGRCEVQVMYSDHTGVTEPYWILLTERPEDDNLERVASTLLTAIPALGGHLHRDDQA
jgi:hypothetical protein